MSIWLMRQYVIKCPAFFDRALMDMNKRILSSALFTVFAMSLVSTHASAIDRAGKWFGIWGWNGAKYSNSDIHFTGDDYDFTLNDTVAKDRQSPFNYNNYFKWDRITIPQTNSRIGYYVDDNYSISFGVDHMKYVMQVGQTVKIDGTVGGTNSSYDGEYDNEDFEISKNFLEYEHTDGLNYINFEHVYSESFYNKPVSENFGVTTHWLIGLGGGVMMPKTNATLLGNERHDEFHFAGLGTNVKTGLNVFLGESFFVQSELKLGYINMWDVRTTIDESDKASQQFLFAQYNILLGWLF